MKVFLIITLLSLNILHANAAQNCNPPEGEYTDLEMVLNQFIFNDGNPNWGDWCFEVNTDQESRDCVTELNQWDNWLECSSARYKTHCHQWADKEGFAVTSSEYETFISRCVIDNYRSLLQ